MMWLLVLKCRLASFICGYEVFQIAVSSSYGVADFKENLLALYTKVSTPFAVQPPWPVCDSCLHCASTPQCIGAVDLH